MSQHLIIAPILIPFVAGALMLLYDDRRRAAKFWLSLISTASMLGVAVALLMRAKAGLAGGAETIGFYLLGDWAAPMAIVLVLDQLAAMMLVLTGVLAMASLVYARASWHRQGQHYFSLFQFLLVGLNGAFLTGDLFNLFVFFEVLLAASYGLLLHGSGQVRVRAGIHYIAINLAGSLLFLLGVSLVYGITGTLNMAHLATMMPDIAAPDRPLLHMGLALLGTAFLIKAGIWPLSFWLPNAYMAAAAPVGAMFAIMTKVGIYVILRLSMLLFAAGSGASAGFGAELLVGLGLATMIFGTLGVLASQSLARMAAHGVILSSGTMLAVIGLALMADAPWMLAGALYYMLASTLAAGALFLMVEPMSRDDGGIAALLALTAEIYGAKATAPPEDEAQGGPGLAAGPALLAGCFALCLLVLAGLPPLPGFVGKLTMIQGLMAGADLQRWIFVGLLLVSGLATLIGLARIGIQTFWANDDRDSPVSAIEIAPIVALIAVLSLISIEAEAVLRYTDRTAQALYQPDRYAQGVLAAPRTTPEARPQDAR